MNPFETFILRLPPPKKGDAVKSISAAKCLAALLGFKRKHINQGNFFALSAGTGTLNRLKMTGLSPVLPDNQNMA